MHIDEPNFYCYDNLLHQDVFDELVTAPCSVPAIGQLLALAEDYGLKGNIWQAFLTLQLLHNENAFSLCCERLTIHQLGEKQQSDSIFTFALKDLSVFYHLFHRDCLCEEISAYQNSDHSILLSKEGVGLLEQITKQLASAANAEEFLACLATHYSVHGVGGFAFYQAFRVAPKDGSVHLEPIVATTLTSFDEIVGYDLQKQQLIHNTEQFLAGKKAQNAILFGDSGTGKSTSIRATLHRYAPQGLRMIELYKHEIQYLSAIIHQLKNRGYHFIIYMDDLSFEEYEVEYKYLKALIDGGLEPKPTNVIIYATSNRRHLVREQWSDRQRNEDDLHKNDTMEEKLSLAARFGLNIYYPNPNPVEFRQIVTQLAKEYDITMPEEDLLTKARHWELRHGGLSGRTARQFIHSLS